MDSVRILHCADLHLGAAHLTPACRSKDRKNDFRKTFHMILEIAEKEKVSLLLIAGDLFDVPSVPRELCEEVRDAFAKAAPLRIAVCSGNHDPATCDSVYLKEDFWPDNVTVFASSIRVEEFPDIGVRLVGAGFTGPYCNHTQLRRMTLQDDEFINIGIMHGTVVPEGQGSEQNPITVRQIEASGLHYLALGHIHTRKAPEKAGLTTYAYPGCAEGKKFGETGEKGVYLAEVTHHGSNVRFIPTCRRRLCCADVDISGFSTCRDMAEHIRRVLEKEQGSDYREQIYRVRLVGELNPEADVNTEMLASLLADIWYTEFEDDTAPYVDEAELETADSLKGVFLRLLADRDGAAAKDIAEKAKKYGLMSFNGEIRI